MRAYDLRLGGSTWGFFCGDDPPSRIPLWEAARAVVEAGLGVEVWPTRSLSDPDPRPEEVERLQAACGDAPFVSVHMRGRYWNWNPVNLRKEIDFAAAVGAQKLVIHPICLGLVDPDDRLEVGEVRRVADYAATRGVRLAVENVKDSIWILDRVLDEVGVDPEETNLGICVDVGHAHLSRDAGRNPVCEYLERYADAMVHLHLHDNAGERDDHLALGEGTIDWRRAVGTLAACGYAGTSVFEIHGGEGAPLEAMENSVGVLQALA
jgi:sugar phosphate isomerase/epimerase